jgi:hypothetical protein
MFKHNAAARSSSPDELAARLFKQAELYVQQIKHCHTYQHTSA